MRRTVALAILATLCLNLPGMAKDKNSKKPMAKDQQSAPVHLDREGEKWAEKTLKKLSLEEKVGQMLMIWAPAEFLNLRSPEYQRLRDAMLKYHLGGFGFTVPVRLGLIAKTEPYEAAAFINELQRDSPLPLMFAADFERGVSMRLNGVSDFPAAMAFGAAGKPEYAEQFGRITAIEARAIGVRWNWFPDADVNSNPANPIINTRAFSGNTEQVSQMVAAYIKGARAAGMMTTAKHFPGHGDTDTDSHMGLARVDGDMERLQTIELPPFRAAIAAGADSVMVAHVTAPALDPDPARVASNSIRIVTDLLRKQFGFNGIIVTDALDMHGLLRIYDQPGVNPSARAAVETVKAGNDMAIIPADIDAAYKGLLQAVRSGEISRAQIDVSVLRVLRAKASVGLHKSRLVDLDALPKLVGSPENKALAQQVADAAVTLVRDTPSLLPLTASKGTNGPSSPYTQVMETRNRVAAVIFTDDVRSEYGRMLERQLRARVPDAKVMYVDANDAEFGAAPILSAVENAERVVAALFVAPQPGRRTMINGVLANPASLQGAQRTLLQNILERAGGRTITMALGNPYIATDFPTVQTYLCTFSNAPVSEISAVKALFGEIPLRGRLPVNIPGIAQRGDGIERAARTVIPGGSGHAGKNRASAGR